MEYQLTRHLALEPDVQDPKLVLAQNLVRRTRLLADEAIWALISSFEKPRELSNDPLESRAVSANILVPVRQELEQSDLMEAYSSAAAQALLESNCPPSDNLLERTDQLAAAYRNLGTPDDRGGFLWQSPSQVFETLLDHIQAYLKLELSESESVSFDSEFLRSSLGRPACESTLEQQTCSLYTSWLRAERIAQRFGGDARILVIGDDDLVSLALSRFETSQIDVLELDTQLVRLLKKEGKQRLKVSRRDLSNGLPSSFSHRYDAVVSDPMYAADGMSMFLECCRNALKRTESSRLFLSTYPPLLQDPKRFFEEIEMNGLRIIETLKHFNRYPFPKEVRTIEIQSRLTRYGYHPQLVQTLLQVPYLYAHLFECGWAEIPES